MCFSVVFLGFFLFFGALGYVGLGFGFLWFSWFSWGSLGAFLGLSWGIVSREWFVGVLVILGVWLL